MLKNIKKNTHYTKISRKKMETNEKKNRAYQ